MPKITLEFDSEKLASEFVSWYLDGGGESEFHDALSCRDVVVFPVFCQVDWFPETKIITHTVKNE